VNWAVLQLKRGRLHPSNCYNLFLVKFWNATVRTVGQIHTQTGAKEFIFCELLIATVRTVGQIRTQTGAKEFIFCRLLIATLVTLGQYSTETHDNTEWFYQL
jgi:hypothetical protein